MKQEHKIWLEPEDFVKLKAKAESSGFTGKGSISHFIEKIAREQIAFLDENVKSILGLLRVQAKKGFNPITIFFYFWKDMLSIKYSSYYDRNTSNSS